MERTVKALDHVINYYMVSRELADLIQAGPHTGSTESLNIYLEALDKLAEAQSYFNKNNPQSVELENINQLYNTGVLKLETAFEELLSRNTRPLSPTTLMDMIALEEDSSVESVSVSNSGSNSGPARRGEAARRRAAGCEGTNSYSSAARFKDYLRSRSMLPGLDRRGEAARRRAAGCEGTNSYSSAAGVQGLPALALHAARTRCECVYSNSGAGRPPAAALLAVRGPIATAALQGFKDYLRSRSMLPDSMWCVYSNSGGGPPAAALLAVRGPIATAALRGSRTTCARAPCPDSINSGAGRPPAAALLAVRGPIATAALQGFKDYTSSRSMLPGLDRRGEAARRRAAGCEGTNSYSSAAGVQGLHKLALHAARTRCECVYSNSGAGRPPAAALLAVRGPIATAALQGFKDYTSSRSMLPGLDRSKNLLNRSDSTTKKTSKIQKVLEKRANKIMMKASQTLEQSTGLAIGPRRSLNESYTEETEALDDGEAELAGSVAACVCRLARHEQRQLLGLVPLPRLPAMLQQVLQHCFTTLSSDRQLLGLVPLPRLPAMLQQVLQHCFTTLSSDVERACTRSRRAASKCVAGAAACWALLAKLQRLQPDVERALAPSSPALYNNIVQTTQQSCIRSLEDWIEGVRNDTAAGAVDGTVHQLAAATLAHCHALASHVHTIGPALANEPAYNRAVTRLLGVQDKDAAILAIYMRKVLAQLNLALRNKSEQYPDALKAIFLLNNTLYLLQGLQRSGLLDVLMLAEPECETNYRDMIQEYKNSYLQSWNKLLSHLVLEEPLPAKLRDRDRQILKDKFASFNREWEEITRAQRGYSVPDLELREALKRDNKQAILPPYNTFYDNYAALPFSKNPDKYVKYTPVQRDNKQAILPPYNTFYDNYAALPFSKNPDKYVKYTPVQTGFLVSRDLARLKSRTRLHSLSVPDLELREALKRDNKQAILPPYNTFYDNYAALPFSKNPDKYVKYTPVQKRDNKQAILPPYNTFYDNYVQLPFSKNPDKYVKYTPVQVRWRLDRS
ncbi:exo70 exocyst complex subunit domain-containing protein [Phthorimaea operculella]|nr:exo70 exocyst complex subunit domain-containing protein [Phthorimaea operculella]